jgi:hypothetical protein
VRATSSGEIPLSTSFLPNSRICVFVERLVARRVVDARPCRCTSARAKASPNDDVVVTEFSRTDDGD